MTSRKRSIGEVSAPADAPARKERSLVDRIRDMWQFANLGQWLFLFGQTVKLDDKIDIEVWPVAAPTLDRPTDSCSGSKTSR
jgi:hypothetical protein